MASAGFYAVESRRIRFGRDGHWYSDGERIEHDRIAALFSRCIEPDPEGGYQLVVGDERAHIEVDDTPYVVRRVDGSPTDGFAIEMNDGSREPLDPATLRIGSDDALYSDVKGGRFQARWLRAACQTVAPYLEEVEGGHALPVGSHRERIRPR